MLLFWLWHGIIIFTNILALFLTPSQIASLCSIEVVCILHIFMYMFYHDVEHTRANEAGACISHTYVIGIA